MTNSDDEIIPIVDLNDEIIGYKARKDVGPDDICRVTGCWITNPEGEILLAQRAWTKKSNPGKRGPAVAGTVAQGETYLENIIKEIKEEIGIDINAQELVFKVKRYSEYNKKFGQRYSLVYTGSQDAIQKQESEVHDLRRYKADELGKYIVSNPEQFTPGTIRAFNNL